MAIAASTYKLTHLPTRLRSASLSHLERVCVQQLSAQRLLQTACCADTCRTLIRRRLVDTSDVKVLKTKKKGGGTFLVKTKCIIERASGTRVSCIPQQQASLSIDAASANKEVACT